MRRQVVIPAYSLESWFFEWVRDELLEERREATEVVPGYPPFPERVKGVMREIGTRPVAAIRSEWVARTASRGHR